MLKRSLSLLVLLPGVAFAQGTGPTTDRVRWAEGMDARSGGMRVRWDRETGSPASLSFANAATVFAESPEAAARELLTNDLAPLFDESLAVCCDPALSPSSGPVLALKAVRDLGNARVRVDFTQLSGAVEVLDAMVSVELARSPAGWTPVAVRSRYCPGIPADMGSAGPTPMEGELAERFGPVQVGELTVEPTCERRVVGTAEGYRLACVVETPMGDDQAIWQLTFDAQTGEELARAKLTCSAGAQGPAYSKNPGETNRAQVPLTQLYVFSGNNRMTTDGKGEHAFAGLVSLDQGLAGPLLRVFVSQEEELTYTGPAEILLSPQEAASEQDEIAAWHNVIDFNAHLGQTYPRFKASPALRNRFAMVVRYKQNGRPLANAFFSPANATAGGDSFPNGYIAMGTFSGREAARSSSVCQHEYCHALFDSIVNLTGTLQAGGLNEGFADYFPAAYKNDPVVGGWLRAGGIRDLRDDYVWPRDDNGDVHRAGHVFSGALWDARTAADTNRRGDAAKVDQAVAEGLFRLRDRPTLLDAREAILDGDAAANAGAFRVTLSRAFNEHGIGPAPNNSGPSLDPIAPQTVRVGETLTVTPVATDPDGDPLSVVSSPLTNSMVDPSGSFLFTPSQAQLGPQQVTLTVSDEEFSESVTFEVDVLPAPSAPTAGSVASVGSSASTASGSTSGSSSKGGGGGGCSLGSGGSPAGGAWILLLGLLGLARARRP